MGKRNVCSICQKTFATAYNLNRHQNVHSKKKNFSCNYCPKRFVCGTSLKSHMFHHTGEKLFACPVCDERFGTAYFLNQHQKLHKKNGDYPLKNKQTIDKKYSCNFCFKLYSSPRALKSHIFKHTGEALLKCFVCNERFGTTHLLRVHKKTHENN